MWWEKYIGLPFSDMGRGPDSYDCWGLVRLVYASELGVHLPSWSAHNGIRDKEIVAEELTEAHKLFQKIEEPEPFSLVLMSSTLTVLHVGIAVSDQMMLHTVKGKDACLECWKAYENQLKGFYRHHDQNSCTSQSP